MACHQSTRLTFKKELIQPLSWNDEIKITVFGEAIYIMTKKDFYESFPNVVASKSYMIDGNYNYKKTPSKAKKYIVRDL